MTRTLLDKLGWKPGTPAFAWRVPDALAGELRPLLAEASAFPAFQIAFALDRAELAEAAAEVAANYRPGGHLWLCYPKKAGRIRSDLTRDVGWEPVHALGLRGVAQIAMDQDWSALRFRKRDEIAQITRRTLPGS